MAKKGSSRPGLFGNIITKNTEIFQYREKNLRGGRIMITKRKIWKIFALAVIMTIGILAGEGSAVSASAKNYGTSQTCSKSGCCSKRKSGSLYCTAHTCSHGKCTRQRMTGSQFCKKHTCNASGCYREVSSANSKCYIHKNSSLSTSGSSKVKKQTGKKHSSYTTKNSSSSTTKNKLSIGSYDDGYDDVYDNDDYDEERYASDLDYAEGVDEAMEDAGW